MAKTSVGDIMSVWDYYDRIYLTEPEETEDADVVVYEDDQYKVVWMDYQRTNFAVYESYTNNLVFECHMSYIHDYGAACSAADEIIEELRGFDDDRTISPT
jgi:hypothetical protein